MRFPQKRLEQTVKAIILPAHPEGQSMRPTLAKCLMLGWLLAVGAHDAASAACSSPAGNEGEVVYNSTAKTAMFCDGTSWWDMKSVNPLAGLSCSAGQVPIWNAATSVWQCGNNGTDAGNITTGILAITRGGTGLGTLPNNGQLLIGNGSGYSLGALTGATGLSVTNGPGSISIGLTSTGVVAGTYSRVTVGTDGRVSLGDNLGLVLSGDITGSATLSAASTTLTTSLANSGVTAGTYGSGSAIPSFTVDAKGRITAASSTAISFSTNSISQGDSSVTVADAGTGVISASADGASRFEVSASRATFLVPLKVALSAGSQPQRGGAASTVVAGTGVTITSSGSANTIAIGQSVSTTASPTFAGLSATDAITAQSGSDLQSTLGDAITGGLRLSRQGRTAAGNTGIIFHSSASSPGYDSQIVASGGSATPGMGMLAITANGGISLSGETSLGGYSERFQVVAATGTTTLDASQPQRDGTTYVMTINGNATITLPTPTANAYSVTPLVLRLTLGAANAVPTFSAGASPTGQSISWSGGTAPTPCTASGAEMLYQFSYFSDTKKWYSSMVWKSCT